MHPAQSSKDTKTSQESKVTELCSVLEQNFDTKINKARLNLISMMILVCNNGLRSSMALKFLEQRGFNNLRFTEGGIVKWIQNNLKIIGDAPDIVSHSLSLDKTCEK